MFCVQRSINSLAIYNITGYFINSYPQLLRFRATGGFATTYDSRSQGLLTVALPECNAVEQLGRKGHLIRPQWQYADYDASR